MSADVSNGYGGGDDAWRPGAPPVTAGDLAACEVLVLHYWAIWDRYDRDMDRLLAPLREEFAGRICFRSCDTDRPENRPFIYDLATGRPWGFSSAAGARASSSGRVRPTSCASRSIGCSSRRLAVQATPARRGEDFTSW
jgi:hypothetical protein